MLFTALNETDFCQQSPLNCYHPQCYAPKDYFGGACLASPFYTAPTWTAEETTPHPHFFRKNSTNNILSEFSCVQRKNERDLLAQNENNESSSRVLWKFKKHSSWMFNKWYDWTGKCIRPTSENIHDFRLSGYHDHKSLDLFHLQNVCIRHRGHLEGFKIAKLFPFMGAEDVFHATQNIEHSPQNWLKSIHQLPAPDECYLDTNLLLFYIGDRLENSGHVFYRKGIVDRILQHRQRIFGNTNPVTIGFVVLEDSLPATKDRHHLVNENALRFFYDTWNVSWFSVFAQRHEAYKGEEWKKIEEEIYGFRIDESQQPSKACFKNAFVWHNALVRDTSAAGDRQKAYGHVGQAGVRLEANNDWAPFSFHLHGKRNERDKETLKMVDDSLIACDPTRVPPRRKKAFSFGKNNATMVLSARSQNRRLSLFPYLVDHIAKSFSKIVTKLDVLEHNKLSFPELIRRYRAADIVMGMYGAGLLFSLFAGEGAIVIEFSTHLNSYNKISGTNVGGMSEFGGGARVANQYFIAIADPRQLWRPVNGGHYMKVIDYLVTFELMDYVRDKIECMLFNTSSLIKRDAAKEERGILPAVPSVCKVQHGDVSRIGYEMYTNSEKQTPLVQDLVRRLAYLRFYPSPSSPFHSPRLRMLMEHFRIAGGAFASYLSASRNAFGKTIVDSALIIEPCAARAQVYAEASFLRQLLPSFREIVIAEYAAGRRFCENARQHNKMPTTSYLDKTIYADGGQSPALQFRWSEGALKDVLVDPLGEAQAHVQFIFCDYRSHEYKTACRGLKRFSDGYKMIFTDCLGNKKCNIFEDSDDDDDNTNNNKEVDNPGESNPLAVPKSPPTETEKEMGLLSRLPSATKMMRRMANKEGSILFAFEDSLTTMKNGGESKLHVTRIGDLRQL